MLLLGAAVLSGARFTFKSNTHISTNERVCMQVRRSMCRIKLVLTERAIAIANTDPEMSRELRLFVNAL